MSHSNTDPSHPFEIQQSQPIVTTGASATMICGYSSLLSLSRLAFISFGAERGCRRVVELGESNRSDHVYKFGR